MTVRLRPHHLLCILTYAGSGYSARFTENFDEIATRLAKGEDVMVVSGPDDICFPILEVKDHHCRLDQISERDGLAARDVTALLGQPATAGSRIVLDAGMLARMRHAFQQGEIRSACAGCDWAEFCTAIAKDFRASKFLQS